MKRVIELNGLEEAYIQVNLSQKYLFLHQYYDNLLNLTSSVMKIASSEYVAYTNYLLF